MKDSQCVRRIALKLFWRQNAQTDNGAGLAPPNK